LLFLKKKQNKKREVCMDWKEKEKKYTQNILRFLWEEGYATAEQFKRHIFTGLTDKSIFHRRKLLKMQNRGFIGRQAVLFSAYSVYYLTEKGWNVMENDNASRISPTHREKISVASGPHRLKCIDARIELEKLLPVEKYYSERTMRLSPISYVRKPDFIFTTFGKRIATEVELTYRSTRRYKNIFACWSYCLQKKMVDKVLFLTDTKARAKSLPEKLKQIIKEQKEKSKAIAIPVPTALKEQRRSEQVWIEAATIKNISFYQIGAIKNEIKDFIRT